MQLLIYDPEHWRTQPTHNTLIGYMLDFPKIAKWMKGFPFILIEDIFKAKWTSGSIPPNLGGVHNMYKPIVEVLAPPIRFGLSSLHPFIETIPFKGVCLLSPFAPKSNAIIMRSQECHCGWMIFGGSKDASRCSIEILSQSSVWKVWFPN